MAGPSTQAASQPRLCGRGREEWSQRSTGKESTLLVSERDKNHRGSESDGKAWGWVAGTGDHGKPAEVGRAS